MIDRYVEQLNYASGDVKEQQCREGGQNNIVGSGHSASIRLDHRAGGARTPRKGPGESSGATGVYHSPLHRNCLHRPIEGHHHRHHILASHGIHLFLQQKNGWTLFALCGSPLKLNLGKFHYNRRAEPPMASVATLISSCDCNSPCHAVPVRFCMIKEWKSS